ncbi:MAG: hypothetical protein JSR77_07295 [Planctomycetes bacterium]|nr:hypothetical protein [Planctomycetota bacterium]
MTAHHSLTHRNACRRLYWRLVALACLNAFTLTRFAIAQDRDGPDEPPPASQPAAGESKPASISPPEQPSKEEIADLKALYDSLSPEQQTEMKAYYSDLGVNLDTLLGLATAKAEQANRARELLGAMKELDWTRRPQAVLAARSKLGFGQVPQPNAATASGQDVAKWLHLHVMAGEWGTVADFLKSRPESDAQGVYSQILQAINKGDAGLLPEEVLAIAEAAPAELKPWQLTSLAGLLKNAAAKHSIGPALAQIKAGTRNFGMKDAETRRRTVDFLASAGLVVEAYDYLPPLEEAKAAADGQLLLVHGRYKEDLASKAVDGPESDANRLAAWELFCEVSMLPKASFEVKREALSRNIGLMNQVPRAKVTPWLTDVFASDTMGPVALEIMALTAVSIGDNKLDVEQRAQSILNLKEAVDILLERKSVESSALRVPMRMLTTALIQEIENTVKEKGRERVLAREAQLLLRAIPNDAWFATMEPSLATRASKACIAIATTADETDLALSLLSKGIKRSPDQAIDLADHFLKSWEQRLNPKSEEDDGRSMFYFYREYLPSAPLTRGRQRRNLDRLQQVMKELEAIHVDPRRLPTIASAFRACHSRTEVYEREDIVRAFGPIEQIPASTSCTLAEFMGASLNGDWRNRTTQQAAGTKRSDSEIAALVDKGYGIALELIESAFATQPDSWHFAAVKAGLAYDRMQFRNTQQKQDPAKVDEYRQAAFTAFEQAAARYAKALETGEERENVAVFTRWFGAALGTPELNFFRVDDMPTEGSLQDDQIERIRKAIAAMSPDRAFRHISDFARTIGDVVGRTDPEIKPRLVHHALRIIGSHPAGASLRSLDELYRDLVKDEIKLRVAIDGDDRVGVNRPFGVLISLRFTNAVDRETGGFAKYLQNNVWGRVGRQYREINYRDQLQKSFEAALSKSFTIETIGFFDAFMPSRGVTESGHDGWLEKPMAYAILTRKDPSIDRIPQIIMDLQFEDQTGPVTLALPSNTPPLAVNDTPAPRPCLDLAVAQIVDTREAQSGEKDKSIKLEVQVRGKGVVPDIKDVLVGLDKAIEGYTIAPDGIEAKPPMILQESEVVSRRFYFGGNPDPPKGGYPEADENGMYRLNVERVYTVTYRPGENAKGAEFKVPTLAEGSKAKFESRYYSDFDLVPVVNNVVRVSPRWLTPTRLVIGGAVLVALFGAGVILYRRKRPDPVMSDGFTLPARITPLTAVMTLRRIQLEHAGSLPEPKVHSLAKDIEELERRYFGPGVAPTVNGDLESVVRGWMAQTASKAN